MKLNSSRFGEIEYREEETIEIARGILGFPNLKKYVVVQPDEKSCFKWLQSIEDPLVAFVVANPLDFFPQYRIKISSSELEDLKLNQLEDLLVFVIITVPKNNLAEISANLLGPVIVNPFKKLAKQVVLIDSPYTTKHYIMEQLDKGLKAEEQKVEYGAVEA
jgi:flagellar assembly factor FliW